MTDERRYPVTPTAAMMAAVRDADLELVRIDKATSEVIRLGTLETAKAVVKALPEGWSLVAGPRQGGLGL